MSDSKVLHRVIRRLAGLAVWSFFTELHVIGEENVPRDGPIIVYVLGFLSGRGHWAGIWYGRDTVPGGKKAPFDWMEIYCGWNSVRWMSS